MNSSQLTLVRKLVNLAFPSSVTTHVLYFTHVKSWTWGRSARMRSTSWSDWDPRSEISLGVIDISTTSVLKFVIARSRTKLWRVGGVSNADKDECAWHMLSGESLLKSPVIHKYWFDSFFYFCNCIYQQVQHFILSYSGHRRFHIYAEDIYGPLHSFYVSFGRNFWARCVTVPPTWGNRTPLAA